MAPCRRNSPRWLPSFGEALAEVRVQVIEHEMTPRFLGAAGRSAASVSVDDTHPAPERPSLIRLHYPARPKPHAFHQEVPLSNRDDVKQSILRAAATIVPSDRVIVYDVDGELQPLGHVSSSNERHWGDLYRRFVALDPYHPRYFVDSPRSVFGTREGFCRVHESPDYVTGFRHVVGVHFKAEVFFRDDRGRIRGGMRFARAPGGVEFTSREMEILEAMQPVLSMAWCTSLDDVKEDESPLRQALSQRERQVLDYVLAGHSNAGICRALGIAMPTVKNHMRSILAKTGAANRRELLAGFYQRRTVAPQRSAQTRPH